MLNRGAVHRTNACGPPAGEGISFGLNTLYLVTDHTELYERLGRECHASAHGKETREELRVYRRISSD